VLSDPYLGLSIKGGSVAGRQGGGREINECYSETKKKKKTDLRNAIWGDTRESVNKIVCDNVWYIRKAPFVLRTQPLDANLLSHCHPA
jgi:hypothetical protein